MAAMAAVGIGGTVLVGGCLVAATYFHHKQMTAPKLLPYGTYVKYKQTATWQGNDVVFYGWSLGTDIPNSEMGGTTYYLIWWTKLEISQQGKLVRTIERGSLSAEDGNQLFGSVTLNADAAIPSDVYTYQTTSSDCTTTVNTQAPNTTPFSTITESAYYPTFPSCSVQYDDVVVMASATVDTTVPSHPTPYIDTTPDVSIVNSNC